MFPLLRPFLFSLDAEKAHHLAIKALKHGLVPCVPTPHDPRLQTSLGGLSFPNPLGMAAGFDKNCEVPNALHHLGFGFVEIGTVTPRPQSGNAKPRIFRLERDHGVINRLGFNNYGHRRVLKRLQALQPASGIIGVNIGANKDSDDFIADYVSGIEAFGTLADYFTINISSPNTPGLRGLQGREALSALLERVFEAYSKIERASLPPVFLKIAPDNDDKALDTLLDCIKDSALSGLIVSNTTVARPDYLQSHHAKEVGGLSGKPLFKSSTQILAKCFLRLEGALPLIGVGGIMNAQDCLEKIKAGATLIQLYSGMIYKGPTLAHDLLKGLSQTLDEEKLTSLTPLIGSNAKEWAHKAYI